MPNLLTTTATARKTSLPLYLQKRVKVAEMLTENEIVEAVAAYLRKTGWEILHTKTTIQQGIDILAQKDGRKLAVEAKGGGSAKPGSARFGLHFTANQKRTHVAVALLKAMQTKCEESCEVGVALPDDLEHTRLISTVLPALVAMNICVFLVGSDRTVHLA